MQWPDIEKEIATLRLQTDGNASAGPDQRFASHPSEAQVDAIRLGTSSSASAVICATGAVAASRSEGHVSQWSSRSESWRFTSERGSWHVLVGSTTIDFVHNENVSLCFIV